MPQSGVGKMLLIIKFKVCCFEGCVRMDGRKAEHFAIVANVCVLCITRKLHIFQLVCVQVKCVEI